MPGVGSRRFVDFCGVVGGFGCGHGGSFCLAVCRMRPHLGSMPLVSRGPSRADSVLPRAGSRAGARAVRSIVRGRRWRSSAASRPAGAGRAWSVGPDRCCSTARAPAGAARRHARARRCSRASRRTAAARRGAGPRTWLSAEHFDGAPQRPLLQLDQVADAHRARRLGRLAIDIDPTLADLVAGQAARLVEARRPQPFVEPGRIAWFAVVHAPLIVGQSAAPRASARRRRAVQLEFGSGAARVSQPCRCVLGDLAERGDPFVLVVQARQM